MDVDLAARQHRRYEQALSDLGCRLIRLPDAPDLPDAVFVEDTAVVLDEVAVAARPGAPSRRPEVASVASALSAYRTVVAITEPATLDGGDVFVAGRRVFVGRSTRTNDAGFEQLARFLTPYRYDVEQVPIRGCLHLKSAATPVAASTLLVNPDFVDTAAFSGLELVTVAPSEPLAANVLPIGGFLLCSASFPRTRFRLESRGFAVRALDLSELAKAEGAVTCCSLVFQASP
ncbi:MAG: dimethylarginine dimethylaminohydrolase family protein [Vicinamibacterales bacterium]